MTYFSKLFLALLIVTSANAQDSIELKLESQTIKLRQNIGYEQIDFSNEELTQGFAYRIIHFNSFKNLDRTSLLNEGIELFSYLPENSYYTKINLPLSENLHSFAINGIYPITDTYKQTNSILTKDFPEHAITSENGIKLNVTFFPSHELELSNFLRSIGGSIISNNMDFTTIQLPIAEIDNLVSQQYVIYIEPIETKPIALNLPGRTSHGSNYLQGYNGTGLQYDGTGITLVMTDDGLIGPHIDLQNRYDQSNCAVCDPDPNITHGDHVAGTIMGAGNLNPYARGMATGINFHVKDAANGFNFFTNEVPGMYTNDSLVLTSRSYGNGPGGNYDNISRSMDIQAKSFPNLLHVCAAGNEGDATGFNGVVGWGNISNTQQPAKNVLVVGAIDKNDVIAGFSSRGPVQDGRIKPDVCGVGVAALSTQPFNTYASWDGTSMATPGVSGTLAQLWQAYKELNSGAYPPSGLMKGIIMNTATDLGNKGPDFIHGYGKINGRKAFEVIENATYITGATTDGQNQSHFINVPPNVAELKIMVYWHDEASTAAATVNLVNDINMIVTDPGMTTYDPWVLDASPNAAALASPAVRMVDNVNNQEQVTIDNPTTGTYEINIDGFNIPNGPQEYYIIYSYNYDEITVTYPNGGEGISTSSLNIVRWDAPYDVTDFTVDYTIDNGATWINAGTAPADKRYFNWSSGTDVTGLARIRVSRNSLSDISDTTFAIIAPPTGLIIDWACPDSLLFSWSPVAGAIGYEVDMLGSAFMDSVTTVITNSAVIQVPGTNEVWLSVRALITNEIKSERAIAIGKQPGEFNCTWSAPYADFSGICTDAAVNSCFDLTNESVNTDGTSTYTWYFPGGNPATSTDVNPTVCYPATGDYDVALVVDNGVDTDSIYITNYFHISNSIGLPYLESFEYYTTFNGIEEWTVDNPDGNAEWEVSTDASLTGQKSAKLKNFGQFGNFTDDLTSGAIDLSNLDPGSDIITLSFRYAYRPRNVSNDEWLKVFVNSSCEDNWTQRKTLHGSQLSPDWSTTDWTPAGPEDWTTVHMTNVTSNYFTNNFRMRFRFESDFGNNLFLENINIYEGGPSDSLILGLNEFSVNDLKLYPNPTNNELNISYNSSSTGDVQLEITDIFGKAVFARKIASQGGNNLVVIDASEFAPGVYFVQFTMNGQTNTERFIVN